MGCDAGFLSRNINCLAFSLLTPSVARYCKSRDAVTSAEGSGADLRCRETRPCKAEGSQKPTSTRHSRDESWVKGGHNSRFTEVPLGPATSLLCCNPSNVTLSQVFSTPSFSLTTMQLLGLCPALQRASTSDLCRLFARGMLKTWHFCSAPKSKTS